MENYKLQPRDYMMLRITNAFVKPNRTNEKGQITTIWRNFSGMPTQRNTKGGHRFITLDLNRKGNKELPFLIECGNDTFGWKPISVEEAIEMGWKVNIFDARERGFEPNEGYVPQANLNVVIYEHDISKKNLDPKIFQHVGNRTFEMVFHPDPTNPDEQPVDVLDSLWFDRVQIRMTHTEANTAYLESMHIYPRIETHNYDDWAR